MTCRLVSTQTHANVLQLEGTCVAAQKVSTAAKLGRVELQLMVFTAASNQLKLASSSERSFMTQSRFVLVYENEV